jgi:hypothetical protein
LNPIHYSKYEVESRRLLYAIIGTLVLEGIIRKLVPSGLSIIIYFVKDFLCILGLYYIASSKLTDAPKQIAKRIKVLIILLYPLLCYNLFIDPILFVWGGKLYLLYTVTAVLMAIAFPNESRDKFKKFIEFNLLLLVVAVFVGVFQLSLPASHWLNQSVDGGSLEAFSAAGILRISSTFSFTGQYSFFLTFASAMYFCNFFLISDLKNHVFNNIWIKMAIGLLLFIGCFSTGGKTAVLGMLSIVGLGFIFIGFKNPVFAFKRLIVPVLIFSFVFPLIQILKPEYFAAYTARSNKSGGSNDDILERVIEPFSGLVDGSFFGRGLGVMTNGSDKVSTYAASIRAGGYWTESDFATIVWEGGMYLVAVWYGFRLFVIFYSFKVLLRIKDSNYYSAAAFLVAYIFIIGLTGTLTIQPPIAIYFWICFGALICIQKFDNFDSQLPICN